MSALPSTSSAPLDGRRFEGVVLERGKTSGDAETESARHGKLRWAGTVGGEKLDGTLTMIRDGKLAGEKWVIAGAVIR